LDDATLASLAEALRLSPDNQPLLVALLRAQLDRGAAAEAAALIGARLPGFFASPDDRALAARALLEAGQAERALAFAAGTHPPLLLLQARALLALDRPGDGRAAYDRAIAANPALEDVTLRTALSATVKQIEPPVAGGPRLKVIANDDTDDSEIDRILAPPERKITFADVGGLEDIKQQIQRRIILPFQKPSLFARFKKRVGGGILLYGPPGCGKTLLARATAGECQASFYNVLISDVLDMYIGESERKLRALFDRARQSTPAVLFFDELEALAGKRQYSREGTASKLVSQFLSEMDGFAQDNRGVLVLGATNVPWAIDPAFRRPGRFDRMLFVAPPDQAAREAILRILLGDRPVAPGIDVGPIARRTSAFSGADLANVVETAADGAIARSLQQGQESAITDGDLRAALDEVKPTALEWLTTARNYARYANESGQYDEVLEFLRKHGKE
jgi:transitional endoplasmic reticulum ATPase